MSRRLRRTDAVFGHGNAGLASNFMDLGHRKLREGGVLALVLPFAFIQGRSWGNARQYLASAYRDLHIVSLATQGSSERAFSADTGMAECLVVATKRKAKEAAGGRERTLFSNLSARPRSLLEASEMAKGTRRNRLHGDILDAGLAGVRSHGVIEAARSLSTGQLRLPPSTARPLAIVALGEVASRGVVHRDINGTSPRGPFDVQPIQPGEVPTYTVLWAHSADAERGLVVRPDRSAIPRPGDEERASALWSRTASRLHTSLDFRVNSQSLSMCLTPNASLGGRAWPNVIPNEPEHEIPLLLWANTTLGLILFWWRGTRQQLGRANMTISALASLPVLDPRALTHGQIKRLRTVLEDFEDKRFLPANEAYRDEARKALDHAVLFDVLELDASLREGLDVLRRQWCAEPSVHGGKKTRPR